MEAKISNKIMDDHVTLEQWLIHVFHQIPVGNRQGYALYEVDNYQANSSIKSCQTRYILSTD